MAQNNWLDEGSTPVPQPTSAAADTSWLDEQSDISQDNALVRGFKKSSQSIGITKGLLTGDSADTARKVAEATDYARKNPGTKEGAELMDAWNRGDGVTGGVTEVAGEFAKDWRNAKGFIPGVRATAKNLQAMGSGIVEQVPNMIAPVAGMIAGGAAGSAAAGPVGTVLGGWSGASLGNTAVEGGSMVQEALQKDKIDPTDQAAVRAYLDKNGDRILGQAGVKGAIIGAVDTATAGLGHFLLSGPGKAAASRALADMGVDAADKAAVRAAKSSAEFKNRIASDAAYQATQQGANKIARNAGAAALEPAGEFAGEFVGQGVATGEWDTKNAALEAASSIGQSGAMYAGQKAIQAFSRPGTATNDPSAQPAPAPGQPPEPPAPTQGTGPTLALPAPDRGVIQVAGDGTARTPAYQAPGYVGDVTDVEPRAVNPVREQVATAAAQGGALSPAALTAIDSGAAGQMQQAAAQTQAAEQAAKGGKKPAKATPIQEQQTQAQQDIDTETGEILTGMARWSDEQLSQAFRGAQSRDVRMQLARELSRRRAERDQQALQAELDAEQRGTALGAERVDAAFASLSEDAGPVPADLSIPATTEGNRNGPQAAQAKQGSAQPSQVGAAPAITRGAEDDQGRSGADGAQQAAAAGLTDGTPTANHGAQAAAAPGAQAAQAGAETTEQRAQRVASAGEAWTRMPAAERQALAQRTDLKPIVQKNVHRTAWESLNGDIQRKLADAMGGRVEAGGAGGEFSDLFDEQGRSKFSSSASVKEFKKRTGLGQDGVRAIQAAVQDGRPITLDEARQADIAVQERRSASLEQAKAASEAESRMAKENAAKPAEQRKLLGDYEIPGLEGAISRVRVFQQGTRIEAVGISDKTANHDLSGLIQIGKTVEQALAALYGDHAPNEAPNPSRVKRIGQPNQAKQSSAQPAQTGAVQAGQPAAPNAGGQVATPTNLREGLANIRAQKQQEAAQAGTAAGEAAGPATIPATTGVARESQASQTQQGSTQSTQAGGPQAGAATATSSASPAGGNRVQAAGLTTGAQTQNTGAQDPPAPGAQAQTSDAAPSDKAKWIKAAVDKSRLNGSSGVQLTVTPQGEVTFSGDPRSTKEGKALLATYEEALRAGATKKEIADALMAARGQGAARQDVTLTNEGDTTPAAAEDSNGNQAQSTGRQAQAATESGALAETREQRAQRVASAGEAWTRMPAAERAALSARADGLNPIQRKRVPSAAWANLNVSIQRKLADAMAPAAAPAIAPLEPVDSLYNPGKPDPKNSAAMDELEGFKPGEAVEVQGRTIGPSTVELVFRRQMAGLGVQPMARVVGANGKKLDVLLSELTRAEQKSEAPAQADPAQEKPNADGSTIVGRRADGVMIRQDKNGVRISETVELRPTRQGMRMAKGELKAEFMTADEFAAAAPAPSAGAEKTIQPPKWWTDRTPAERGLVLRASGVPGTASTQWGRLTKDQQIALNEQWGPKDTNSRSAQAQTSDAGNVQPSASAHASAQKPAAKKPSADQTRAKADLMSALADLGDILGKNTRMNIVPEQEQKLLPVLTRVLDAAFRLGYHKFKDSAKFALDQIREHLGADAADALTLDHLQGAYIAMAGGKQGADTKRAVIDVESKADIEAHEAVTADSETDTMESPAEGAAPTGADDERNNLPSQSPQALGKVAAAEGGQPESSGRAGAGAADGGQGSRQDGGRADGAGVPAARGGGSGTGRVRAAQAGARGKSGAVGTQGTGDAGAPAPAADGRVAVPGGASSAPNIPAANFQITDEVALGKGGEVQKFNDNLAAIRALKQIEAENRRATPDEQAALARYVGWGGLASAFPDPISGEFKDKWKPRGEELRELLTDAEYKAARRSTRNAHYTSQTVVKGIWDAVRRLGYRGGLVLESSMGSGNFLGLAPTDLVHRFVGVEYDSLTARIGQALYPQATVLHSGFQQVPMPDNAFMLNIGNPPFGSESLRFQFKPELQGVSIHNQFFRAGMDALRPGGIQAMVVSRYLMDAKDKSSRLAMASKARLIAAIRLPDTAFKENARTEVVTDILIFQKLEPGEQAAMEVAVEEYRKLQAKVKDADAQAATLVPAWVETVELNDPLGGEPMTVNTHFQQNPGHVLGVMERSGSMQHGADITVRLDNPAELGERLAAVVASLPQNIQSFDQEVLDGTAARHRSMSDALRIALAAEEAGHVKATSDGKLQRVIERETPEGDYEFAYQDIDENSPWSDSLSQDAEGRWYELVEAFDEQGQKVKALGKDGKPTKRNVYERKVFADVSEISPRKLLGKTGFRRLSGLVKLRDLLKRQLTLETADAAKAVMEGNRKALAAAYAEFVKANGPVSRPANLALAMTMPDGGLVAALEVGYQPERTAAQAASSGLPEQKESTQAAPILRERVVPKYEPATKAANASDALAITLSERGRVDMERIASLLGVSEDAAATQLQAGADPLVFKDPESGTWETADVYLSGMVKRKLNAARSAGLAMNVHALEKVIPEDWTAENVQATMGATWVPPDVYAAFLDYLAGGKAKVSFSGLTNSFSVHTGNTDPSKFSQWSSEGAPVDYIVARILNSKPVTVTAKDENGNIYVDKERTALAGLKAREIVAEFGDWVFKDGERRQRLVQLFNEKFNTRVVRQYNGQHLALPGKVPDAIIKMRRHQLNAIWRGIYERFMLVDHAVGAGKTFTAIARAMERRRMGLSRKPMIVVPNHLVEQWEADVYRLYPGAKVLAAGKSDFEAKRRRRLFGKIATGDWDIVIVPHSSFGFIGISQETESRYLELEMAQAQAAIQEAWEQAKEDGTDNGRRKPFGVKEAERLAEKIQARMDRLKEGVRDRLLTFEQMGVDDLTVDEAHEFKNLYYSSNLTGVRGMGDKTGSRKANDLYNKVRVLTEQPTATVSFLTGTPISNSAVEMFTMLRYLASGSLEEMGLTHFDAFRTQFVEATPAFEHTESGRLKQVTRLGRTWSNMRSLMDLYYQVTDAVSLEDIKRFYAEDNPGQSFPVPQVAGGKDRQLIAIKPTHAQEQELISVMSGFDGLEDIEDPYERNAERLRLMDRARKVSLDVRAVNPRNSSAEEGGKLQRVSQEVKRIYDKWDADKGTQLIFLDRSVPKSKGDDAIIKAYDALVLQRDAALAKDDQEGYQEAQEALDRYDPSEIAELRMAQQSPWNAYQQIKDNLVAMGVPADEIRFVQEANNDEQKAALFDAVNGGKVRVLLGSTPRMGAGTNVQKRAVALHHVDVTWKPSDIEQREGRVVRQGNELLAKHGDSFEVEILAYATERTVDAKMWDLNATKLRTINGIRKYQGAFTMEFDDEEAVGMAEMAALASGNPLLLERVQIESEIQTMEMLERAHRRKMWGVADDLDRARRAIERNPAMIERASQRTEDVRARIGVVDEAAHKRSVTVEGERFSEQSDALRAAEAAIKLQQEGNDKARFAITIDGERVSSKDAVSAAIGAALGDVDTFEATVNGNRVFQRTGAAREIAALANQRHHDKDGSTVIPLGALYGYELVADIEFVTVKGDRLKNLRLSLMDGEKTVASDDANEILSQIQYTATNIRAPLERLVDRVRTMASGTEVDFLSGQLERAKRDLPALEARAGEGFPKATELAAKRTRLKELVSLLDSGRPAAPVPADSPTDDGSQPVGPVLFSRATDSVPQTIAEWLSDTVIADEVEKRIGGFAQQPPVRIRDTAFGQLPGVARNDNVAGAVHDGAIYLFRDQLGDRAAVQRTLFHELFHYGLRKFLTKDQFTGQMMNLYRRDRAIKEEADRWAATADGLRAKEFGGDEYALARGVDEALAILAEPNGGPHLNQTARAMLVRRVTNWLADVAQFLKMDEAAAHLRSMHNSEAREYIQSVFKRLERDEGGRSVNWANPEEAAFAKTTASLPAAGHLASSESLLDANQARTQSIVDAIAAGWTRKPADILVVRNMQDAQVPQRVREHDAALKSQGATGEPRGFIYQGKVYLLSDQLHGAEQVTEVLFHEVLGHYGLQGAFGVGLKPILQQLATMRRALVEAKAQEYGLDMSDEEQRLQAAEEVLAEMAQTRPEIGFVQRAIAAIRNWLRAHVPGLQTMSLTDADIIQAYILPARGWVERGRKAKTAGAMPMFQRDDVQGPDSSAEQTAGEKALAAFAQADELFALPKSTKDTVEGIAADNDARFTISRPVNIGGRLEYTFTLPDGTKATLSVRDPNPFGGEQVYDARYTDDGMELVPGRPGENPDDVPPTGDVWIDVSDLKNGDFGAKMYNIAATYAHNTGRIFIGDPHGLSKDALRRRLEQMISSALKFGTTAHLAPHPDQTRGGHGVPPLRWVYGDHVGNVERMIAASVKALDNAFPTSNKIAYDSDRGFYRTDTGRALDRGQLAVILKRSATEYRLAHGAGATGQAGWRTVARAALFRHFQSSIRDAASGIPQRGSLLARGGKDVSRLERGEAGEGAFDANERIFYSRARGVSAGGHRATLTHFAATAREELSRTFAAPGGLSWWHKTVGTMYNLAERSPVFKRVYESAQGFVDDVSYYATDAAELAPKLLPKLENWRDITKRPITAADNAAVAKPVFEGTLDWTRDEAGKPVRLQVLLDAAAKLTTEQKAQRLLRHNKISEGMLKAWLGLPLEQYDKLVASRYESQMLKVGIVWTAAELKSQFKLNDTQVALYQEFRAATDRSLDTMARADMLRYGGKDVYDLRELVMDAADAQDAAHILREHLQSLAREFPERAGELGHLSNGMLDRAARVLELQEQGYAPLSRFGKYTVDVVDESGERQYFGLFETAREANLMAMKMRKGFGHDAVTQGTLSEEEFKLLAGITPESLELFGNMLGLDATGSEAQDQAFQEYLRRTKTNRSAMRRLIHRQGIAGYSEDVGRVLASFIYSNARQTSAGLHMGELGEAITDIPKQQGDLKDAAIQLSEYVKNPQEEAQAVRGLLFAQYLGGSIASAFVNMTQPMAVSFPWLSQFGGAQQAATQLGRAAKNLSSRGHRFEADLATALRHAEDEGTVSPQEVHQLMAQARGSGSLRPGDGTRGGNARAAAGNALTRLSLAWGKVFGVAEQVNRRMTFIAAFRIAKAQGMANPAAFAKKAVVETQFVYSKANKMKWGRGAVGATVMTFKTYSIAYLELLGRMWNRGGPEGKRAVMLALAMLMLMGGAGGLPFAEDAEDLADGLAQMMGYNFSSKKAKQEFLESLFGEAGAGFIERGITGLPGMPLDVSGRLGMGNLVPGTGLFKEKTDHTRDVLEVVGPVGDLAKRVVSGGRSIVTGDVGAGLLQMAPAAVRNAAKGADMAARGMYRDDKGYKVLDTSATEAAMKLVGFQPASVAKVQEANAINQQAKNFYGMQAQEIRAKWARGIFEKDADLVAEARADLERWNRKNPSQRIVVSMPDVWRRVRKMAESKEQRIADTAPRAMRQALRAEVAGARAEL